ncbi:RNA polymerase sigma factor, partial [Bacteroidota bacterium]
MVSEKEFIKLIHDNSGIIYKVVRLFICNQEDEKDAVQEILYQCWRAIPHFRYESKFSTWLYKISLNTMIILKRKKRIQTVDSTIINNFLQQKSSTDENLDNLDQCISQLGDADKMVISLQLEGYKIDEISEITGISKSNVGVKIHRIK